MRESEQIEIICWFSVKLNFTTWLRSAQNQSRFTGWEKTVEICFCQEFLIKHALSDKFKVFFLEPKIEIKIICC